MTRLADVKAHRIFRVEQRGRALVVTPMGDSPGFGNADFKVERERVMALIAKGREPVIIDFGEANYFGSEMIGVVSRMLSAVRERGGTYAVVNVSNDMRKGLAIMKLDERWNLMDERTALRDVAKESALSSIHRHRKPLLLLLASLVLVGGSVYAYLSIDRSQDVRDYETLLGIWENLQIKRIRPAYELELQSWKREQVERLEPTIARWEQGAANEEQLPQVFLNTTREHLVKLLDPYTRHPDPALERAFLEEMEKARKLIETQERVKLSRLSNPHRVQVDSVVGTTDPPSPHDAPPPDSGHAAPPRPTPTPPVEHDAPSAHDASPHDADPPRVDPDSATPGESGDDAPTKPEATPPTAPPNPEPDQPDSPQTVDEVP